MCHARPNARLAGMSTNREKTTRHAGLLAALLALIVLLATACSGSNSPGAASSGSSSPSGSTSASAVAYSACMRYQGIPNFPDPGSSGSIPKETAQQLGVSNSRFQSAERACQSLYPTSSLEHCSETGVCSPADRQELLNRMREFAECVRSHGVPDFPDPGTGPDGVPYFNLLHLHGVDPRSHTFEDKMRGCEPNMGDINFHVARP